MKRIVLTIIFLSVASILYAQVPSSIRVLDTRNKNEAPTFYNREVKFEFKKKSVLSLPGSGYYSALMTVAPWVDNTGGEHHQLNFNQAGIFYRTGMPDASSWGSWNRVLIENGEGNVGIGTTKPDAKLAVNGDIHTKEIKVDLNGWADFVFKKDYNLPSLKQVEKHIQEKGHLADIPSAKEVAENGVKLGEMNKKLLQKIEELTLYTIAQEKRLKAQDERQKMQEERIKNEEVRSKKQEERIKKQEEEKQELLSLVKALSKRIEKLEKD